MNWGLRIVIGMGLAMTAVVATGIYMVSKDSDTLEENDYYERGMQYEAEYEKKENVVRDHSKATVLMNQDSLIFHFTGAENKGIIYLKRPSDRNMDKTLPFVTSTSYYQISRNQLHTGAWQIRIEWQHDGRNYLQDEHLFLQ